MFSYTMLITILSIISGLYALPYGNWEFKNRKILSGIIIYIIGITGVFLGVLQYFCWYAWISA